MICNTGAPSRLRARAKLGAMTHAKTMAVVWGSEPPAFSIGY